jgi:uncharacterized protein
MPMMVKVELRGLYTDPNTGSSVVILGETRTGETIQDDTAHPDAAHSGEHPDEADAVTTVVPIFIGAAEAQSIAIGLQGLRPHRPLTHDLLLDAMDAMGGRLVRVCVTGLDEGTFLAELELETPDGAKLLDSRPSDGIALAVRVGAEICIDRDVLDAAGIEAERHEPDERFDDTEIEAIVEEFQEYLATVEPSDFDDEGHPGRPEPEV